MNGLPLEILQVHQVRELEVRACEVSSIPSYTLMQRAGESALATLRACWPGARMLVVICGPGNNGGDGYVLARLALQQRLTVRVCCVSSTDALRGDAARAFAEFRAAGGQVLPWSTAVLDGADVVVDAILGTGVSRAVAPELAAVIESINTAPAAVFSLDIPSGLNADSGAVMGAAVRAHRTLSFVALKPGYYLGEGPNHIGVLMFDDLEIPQSLSRSEQPLALRIDDRLLTRALPARSRTSHKGQHGRVLIVGGGPGMAGAARLAGEAALRVGAGLVTVATRPESVAAIVAGRPELMCRGVEGSQQLAPLLESAEVIAIGPGLGQDAWAEEILSASTAAGLPMVVDADGLNLLARQAAIVRADWVLTPHPGEASRLLNMSTAQVQADRIAAARAISARFGGTVVLKGAGSLIVSEGTLPRICDRGNPGMASPGMGDVLTGVIAGLLGQIGNCHEAACAGVLVHAMAGDIAARRGERGLLASDLFAHLQTCVNPAQSF